MREVSKPYFIAVRAIIKNDEGKWLLIRRSKICRSFAGTWEWPGGKVDEGETLDRALAREVEEETGLEVDVGAVAGAYGFEMAEKRIVVICFEAKLVGGAVKISEEHDDFVWAGPGELGKWEITPMLKEFAASHVGKKGM